MVKFQAIIQKFQKKGEKTGWTYILIQARYARLIKPNTKVSFRVKGLLDKYAFSAMAVLPMGKGDYILPLNASIRRSISKKEGDKLSVQMELDNRPLTLSPDLVRCLKQEPASLVFFKTLPRSHQNYFSKWIESAKTVQTKAKRLVMAVTALAQKQGYGEMIRSNKTFQ